MRPITFRKPILRCERRLRVGSCDRRHRARAGDRSQTTNCASSPHPARSIQSSKSVLNKPRACRCSSWAMANGIVPGCGFLLEKIVPELTGSCRITEVDHVFPEIGHPHHVPECAPGILRRRGGEHHYFSVSKTSPTVSKQNAIWKNCCRYKEALLDEMEQRIANSLQIIASIILMKARNVTSEETRLYLKRCSTRGSSRPPRCRSSSAISQAAETSTWVHIFPACARHSRPR